jgi:hypothetical protein
MVIQQYSTTYIVSRFLYIFFIFIYLNTKIMWFHVCVYIYKRLAVLKKPKTIKRKWLGG